MAFTNRVRTWWSDFRCLRPSTGVELLGRSPVRLADPIRDAGAHAALEDALISNGYGNANIVGSYNCRGIGGKECQEDGTDCSLHAYGVALDIDPAQNPHLRRRIRRDEFPDRVKLTIAQVDAVEEIRTESGDPVWRWLGWSIGDTMHFQIDSPPDVIATGIDWSTVGGDSMWPAKGDQDNAERRRFAVEAWQLKLAALEGHPYPGEGSTRDVIEAAELTVGVYDDAMEALVARHTDTAGGGIGPRQAAQIDAKVSGGPPDPDEQEELPVDPESP